MTNWQRPNDAGSTRTTHGPAKRMIANAAKEKSGAVHSYRPQEQQMTEVSDGIRPELLTAPRMVWKRKPPAILEANPFLARM